MKRLIFYVSESLVGTAIFVAIQFGWWMLHLPYFNAFTEFNGAAARASFGPVAIAISTALFISGQLAAFFAFRSVKMLLSRQ
jgi:hypothetical protein